MFFLDVDIYTYASPNILLHRRVAILPGLSYPSGTTLPLSNNSRQGESLRRV